MKKEKPQSKVQNTKGALLTSHSKFHPACKDGRVHCFSNAGNVTNEQTGDDGREVGKTGKSFVKGMRLEIQRVPKNVNTF